MSKRSPMLSLALAGLLLSVSASAQAGLLKVPDDFPSIQSAVDAAVAGDTILVTTGTYAEAVDIWEKTGLTIRGVGKVVMEASQVNTAFTVAFCSDIEIRGITVNDCREHAFVVACSDDVLITKCRVIGGDLDGIRVFSGSGCRLERNRVEGVANIGIRVLEQQPNEPGGPPGVVCSGPEGTVLYKNKVLDTGSDGISVWGFGHVVEKNRVTDAGGDGIVSLLGDVGSQFLGNRVVGGAARGFVLAGAGATLEKNRIKASAGVGLLVESTADGSTLVGNKVVKSAKNGFELLAAGVTCSGTRVVKAGAHAYVVGGAGHELQGCKASGTFFVGFYVSADACTFTQCRATDSGLLDLQDADAGESTNSYLGCTFKTSNLP